MAHTAVPATTSLDRQVAAQRAVQPPGLRGTAPLWEVVARGPLARPLNRTHASQFRERKRATHARKGQPSAFYKT